jgi:hypothetical protein
MDVAVVTESAAWQLCRSPVRGCLGWEQRSSIWVIMAARPWNWVLARRRWGLVQTLAHTLLLVSWEMHLCLRLSLQVLSTCAYVGPHTTCSWTMRSPSIQFLILPLEQPTGNERSGHPKPNGLVITPNSEYCLSTCYIPCDLLGITEHTCISTTIFL